SLVPPSISTANTLPAQVVSDRLRAALQSSEHAAASGPEASARKLPPGASSVGVTQPSGLSPPVSPAERRAAISVIPPTLESPTSDLPRQNRWIWAVVAIVAAALGVVIGALVGTR